MVLFSARQDKRQDDEIRERAYEALVKIDTLNVSWLSDGELNKLGWEHAADVRRSLREQ